MGLNNETHAAEQNQPASLDDNNRINSKTYDEKLALEVAKGILSGKTSVAEAVESMNSKLLEDFANKIPDPKNTKSTEMEEVVAAIYDSITDAAVANESEKLAIGNLVKIILYFISKGELSLDKKSNLISEKTFGSDENLNSSGESAKRTSETASPPGNSVNTSSNSSASALAGLSSDSHKKKNLVR